MTRTEIITFHGGWRLHLSSSSAVFRQKIVIEGSTNLVGGPSVSLAGTLDELGGPQQLGVLVVGQTWLIKMMWTNTLPDTPSDTRTWLEGSNWQPSDIRRHADYSIQDGLIITLYADDNYPNEQDFDYNDLIITCTSVDPKLNPIFPNGITRFSKPSGVKLVPAPIGRRLSNQDIILRLQSAIAKTSEWKDLVNELNKLIKEISNKQQDIIESLKSAIDRTSQIASWIALVNELNILIDDLEK